MCKILCFIFVCHLNIFVSAQTEYYTEKVKVTHFEVEPNNGVFDYNAGEEAIKPLIDDDDGRTPIYYNYKFKTASGKKGTGTDVLCDFNSEDGKTEEQQRLQIAIVYALGGRKQCPSIKGRTYYVKKHFSYGFNHKTDGDPVSCEKNTAEITITGTTKTGKVATFKLESHLRGGKCK